MLCGGMDKKERQGKPKKKKECRQYAEGNRHKERNGQVANAGKAMCNKSNVEGKE